MSSASAKVFETIELAEFILNNLRDLDAAELTRLQFVNSTFKALVEKLFGVERFLEPAKTCSYAYWDWRKKRRPKLLYLLNATKPTNRNKRFKWPHHQEKRCVLFFKLHPILKGHVDVGEMRTLKEFNNPDLSGLETRKDTSNYREGARGWNTDMHTYVRLDGLPILNLTRGGEWEKCFVTQPPTDMVRMEAHATMSEDESRFFESGFGVDHSGPEPVTLGELRDKLEEQIQKVEKKYPFEGVTMRFPGMVLVK